MKNTVVIFNHSLNIQNIIDSETPNFSWIKSASILGKSNEPVICTYFTKKIFLWNDLYPSQDRFYLKWKAFLDHYLQNLKQNLKRQTIILWRQKPIWRLQLTSQNGEDGKTFRNKFKIPFYFYSIKGVLKQKFVFI